MPRNLHLRADPLRLEGLAAQLQLKAQFQCRGLWGENWPPHWRPLWWNNFKETAKQGYREEAAELFRIGAPPFVPGQDNRNGNPPWTGHERAFVVALDALGSRLADMPLPPTQENRRRLAALAAFVEAKRRAWSED